MMSVQDILQNFIDNLNTMCDRLAVDSSVSNSNDFSPDVFWSAFTHQAKRVSHEATKIQMMFYSDGLTSSQECRTWTNNAETACTILVTLFLTFPQSQGKTIQKELRLFVVTLLQCMKSLSENLKVGKFDELTSVGRIWNELEVLENFPRDNREAVIQKCTKEKLLLSDAVQELNLPQESIDPEDTEASKPNEKDVKIIDGCKNLIKAAYASIKKAVAIMSEHSHIPTDICDKIAVEVAKFSPLVDDLAVALDVPFDENEIVQLVTSIRDNANGFISLIENPIICSEKYTPALVFLHKAVDHNWNIVKCAVAKDD